MSLSDVLSGYFQTSVINCLEKQKVSKNERVREAATKTLKVWNKLEVKYVNAENKKMNPELNESCDNSQLIEFRTNEKSKTSDNFNKLKMLRNLSKINKNKIMNTEEQDLKDSKERQEIYRKGIGNVIKMAQYVNRKQSNIRSSQSFSDRLTPSTVVKNRIKDFITKSNDKYSAFNHDDFFESPENNMINHIQTNELSPIIKNSINHNQINNNSVHGQPNKSKNEEFKAFLQQDKDIKIKQSAMPVENYIPVPLNLPIKNPLFSIERSNVNAKMEPGPGVSNTNNYNEIEDTRLENSFGDIKTRRQQDKNLNSLNYHQHHQNDLVDETLDYNIREPDVNDTVDFQNEPNLIRSVSGSHLSPSGKVRFFTVTK